MQFILNCDLEYQLKKDFKKFKSMMLDLDEKNINIFEDEDKAWNLYILSIVWDNNTMIKCIKKLIKNGVNQKVINDYFKNFIKMKYKMQNGIWSWNEIDEYDIDFNDVKKTRTNMSFL